MNSERIQMRAHRRQQRVRVRRLLLTSLMLSLLANLTGSGAISATSSPSLAPTAGMQLVSPKLGTFVQQVRLVGDVAARKQIYMAPPFGSKLEMLAEDGALVKKGDIVARLDVKSIEEELDEQALSADVARAALVEHDRSTASEQVRLDAEIQRAQASVEQKTLALRQLEQGTRPEELRKQLLNRNLAQRALELSRSTLALKERLAAKGISSKLEILQARLDLVTKERDQRVAEATYQQGLAGATPLSRQIARMDLDKAQRSLSWARQNLALSREQAGLDRQKLLAQQNNVNGRVSLLRRQLAQATVRAPIQGTVVLSKAWTREGLKRATVGDDVQEGNPFLSIADLTQVVLSSELDETLLRDVRIGMPATIQLPSQRGRQFSGKVQRIGVLAHARSNRENTEGLSKVFDLDIWPDSENAAFKPGTSVDIQLPLVQRPNVLLLPRAALLREGGRHYVLLADGSQRTVRLGDANADVVVITQGLSATDQVMLPEGNARTDVGTDAGTDQLNSEPADPSGVAESPPESPVSAPAGRTGRKRGEATDGAASPPRRGREPNAAASAVTAPAAPGGRQ